MPPSVPVITIDGPTASGKGTISRRVASQLGWRHFDSGALYRLAAFAAIRSGISFDDEVAVARLSEKLDVVFYETAVFLDGQEVTLAIRSEVVSDGASRIAESAIVREALLVRQRLFRRLPGLVADGRDMGTVVFPDADLKIFLTANQISRVQRRYRQLVEQGESASIALCLQRIEQRDARDISRRVAPLKPAEGARVIDATDLRPEEVVAQVVEAYETLCSK